MAMGKASTSLIPVKMSEEMLPRRISLEVSICTVEYLIYNLRQNNQALYLGLLCVISHSSTRSLRKLFKTPSKDFVAFIGKIIPHIIF